jgi:hypothetical protein
LASELDVQALGLGNNGRNDLPGLPPEVSLAEDALSKVALWHSSRPYAVWLKVLQGGAIPWWFLPLSSAGNAVSRTFAKKVCDFRVEIPRDGKGVRSS